MIWEPHVRSECEIEMDIEICGNPIRQTTNQHGASETPRHPSALIQGNRTSSAYED